MLLVIQKSLEAKVTINGSVEGKIDSGYVMLIGIESEDNQEDISWLSRKVVNLRLFEDESGVMNRSILDVDGDILLISQFTLHASTKKGNRPSYIKAAKPEIAIPIYNSFIEQLEMDLGKGIQTGKFGANMKVSLTNNGPVTLIIDSKNKK